MGWDSEQNSNQMQIVEEIEWTLNHNISPNYTVSYMAS